MFINENLLNKGIPTFILKKKLLDQKNIKKYLRKQILAYIFASKYLHKKLWKREEMYFRQ